MALLPPFFLNTVSAIGIGDDPARRSWIGTGFLFGDLVSPKTPAAPSQWRVWLITNKHVLAGLKTVYVKFNSAVDPHSKDYGIPLVARNGKPNWVGHPKDNVDVAVVAVPVSMLKQEQRLFRFFQSESHAATRTMMQQNEVTEGDRVFVLGFPMGLVDASRQYVICRGGVIARVRDYLEGKASDLLVDATVFPGNSGGPVILCPAGTSIQGTKRPNKAELIGVVKSYVPYADLAVSSQTRKPRIMFEENSGLAAVEGVDAILETVSLANRRLKARVAQAKHKARKGAAPGQVPAVATPAPVPVAPPSTNPARRR